MESVLDWRFMKAWLFGNSHKRTDSATPTTRIAPSTTTAEDDVVSSVVAGVRAGEHTAFAELVRSYHNDLFAFAARKLGSPDQVDDILQDVFFSVWNRREHLPNDPALRVYLFRAVRNAIIDTRRSSGRSGQIFSDDTNANDVAGSDDPADRLAHDEMVRAIERAVQALPDRGREAWILVRECGLSYSEAAAVLGIGVGTIHVHLSRAFAAIRKAVAPYR